MSLTLLCKNLLINRLYISLWANHLTACKTCLAINYTHQVEMLQDWGSFTLSIKSEGAWRGRTHMPRKPSLHPTRAWKLWEMRKLIKRIQAVFIVGSEKPWPQVYWVSSLRVFSRCAHTVIGTPCVHTQISVKSGKQCFSHFKILIEYSWFTVC